MAKDNRIAIRTSEAFKERVRKAAQMVRLDETTLVEKALEAVVEYIEHHGGIWLPLEVEVAEAEKKKPVPIRDSREAVDVSDLIGGHVPDGVSLAAEEPAKYKPKKPRGNGK